MQSTLGPSGSLTTQVIRQSPKKTKAMRVRHFGIPGLGRIAFTRDQGEAELFSSHFLRSRLWATKIDNEGQRGELMDLGSGLVSNVGVLALAGDLENSASAKAKEPFNLFSFLKWQAWAKSATAAKAEDIKIAEYQKPNEEKATEVTTREMGLSGVGKPKFITKGKIKAESTTEIKSWGLFTTKESLAGKTFGTGKFVSVTSSTGKASGAVFTASSDEIKGERLTIALATESENTWLLVKSSTTEVLTGFGASTWYKEADGTFKEPAGTSAYKMYPALWDHRVFTTVGVESGNEIEFIYELEFPAGG